MMFNLNNLLIEDIAIIQGCYQKIKGHRVKYYNLKVAENWSMMQT